MKHNLIILFAAIIALVSGWLFQQTIHSPQDLSKKEVMTLLESTELSDVEGQKHRLSEWQGKLLIINFWATWCPPCLEEIPHFIDLQQRYRANNVQFLGIAVEEKDTLIEHSLFSQLNYPVLIAGNHGIGLSKPWGNFLGGVPFSVIVSPNGEIIHRKAGELSVEKIEEVIKPFL